MREIKQQQGGNDDDAPRSLPHPGFVRGLCFLCGAKEEDAEGCAPGLAAVGSEMTKKGGGGGDGYRYGDRNGNDDAARFPPHPGFVYGLSSLCGAEEAEAKAAAPGAAAVRFGMMKQGSCPPHPGFVLGLCYGCGALEEDVVGSASGVTMSYTHAMGPAPAPPLPVRAAATSIARASDLATLFRQRKLVLILDLDLTLLDSTGIDEFSPMEQRNGFTATTSGDPRRDLFRMDFNHERMLIKLRPFVRGFLQQASAMFELHVYTLGNQLYARGIVGLLDPDGVYFGSRVVSRDVPTLQDTKNLDVIQGAEVVAVVILDDTDTVWPGHQDNLILMNRYHYFASDCRLFEYDINSLAELGLDEREHDGSLAVMLGVLKRVHQGFFDGHRDDVREVIRELRRQVLPGCTVAFSYLEQSMEDVPEETLTWTLAERLGAVCKKDVDETVTHVVAVDPGTQKAQWARDHGKFLVNPEWIKAASFLWCRQDELEFPVTARGS